LALKQKTIHIHIGQHKTGTTSIQNFLWGNRAALADAGYGLANTGFVGGAHHAICYAFLGLKGYCDPDAMMATLEAEISDGPLDNIVLSSEEFERLTLPMVARLARKLGDHAVRPILYLRRQDGYLLSDYGQQVKMGAALPPIGTYLDNPSFPERFNFLGLLGNWSPANILSDGVVTLYDKGVAGSVVRHFAETIGLTDPNLVSPSFDMVRSNTSWSYQEVDLIRRISISAKQRFRVRSAQLQEVYGHHFPALAKLCADDNTPLHPTRAQFHKIRLQYRHANLSAGRIARLNEDDCAFLAFETGSEAILETAPRLASDHEVRQGVELVMDAMGAALAE